MKNIINFESGFRNSILNIGILMSLVMLSACSETAEPTSTEIERSEADGVEALVAAEPEEDMQPNVVFILVDDLGFADVGYNGSEIATPNLDQMASEGVQLDRNYVYPICSPTRAALLTGHSPLEFGIDGPTADGEGLSLDVQLMPEYFKELGYQTFMVGKWHLGIGNRDFWPISRGFDYHYGFLGGWVDFYTHVYTDGLDWQRGGDSVREEGHATDLLADDAVRVISGRDESKPFFLYLSLNAPHFPLQFVPEETGLNDHIEMGDRRVYADMVTHLDAAIGAVLDTLEQEGVLENTIVVFSSDNGGSLNYGASNGELRGAKGSTYEGGTRVPGLIWWPGTVDGGVVLDQPIIIHDWLPTLMEAVGGSELLDEQAMHGQSMWAALSNGEQVERELTTISVHFSKSAIDWPWKVVNHTARGEQSSHLFNVVEDPNEQNDLKDEQPERYAQLSQVIADSPSVPSLRTLEPTPAPLFRNEEGGWDYNIRLEETREPWAESALQGGEE